MFQSTTTLDYTLANHFGSTTAIVDEPSFGAAGGYVEGFISGRFIYGGQSVWSRYHSPLDYEGFIPAHFTTVVINKYDASISIKAQPHTIYSNDYFIRYHYNFNFSFFRLWWQ